MYICTTHIMYACTYVHTVNTVRTYVRMYCMYVRTDVRMYVRMYVCMYVFTYSAYYAIKCTLLSVNHSKSGSTFLLNHIESYFFSTANETDRPSETKHQRQSVEVHTSTTEWKRAVEKCASSLLCPGRYHIQTTGTFKWQPWPTSSNCCTIGNKRRRFTFFI